MPGFDDEIDAALAEEEAPAAPRPGYGRRTVLGPIHVEGDPTGRGRGRSTFADPSADRVEDTGLKIAEETPPSPEVGAELERQAAARAPVIRRERQAQRDAAHSPAWDTLLAIAPADPYDTSGARRRTGERVSDLWSELSEDPLTVGRQAAETLTAGLDDEMATTMLPEPMGERWRRGIREQHQRDQRERPYASTVGAVAGTAPLLAVPGATAPTAAGRLGAAAGEGAIYGALSGVGHADPPADATTSEAIESRLLGGAEGALAGGGMGLAFGAGGELVRGGGRALEHLGGRRDELLLGATTTAGRGQTAIRAFDHGDSATAIQRSRARSAQALRDTGAIPRVGTISGVRGQIEQARGRVTDVMDEIRSGMDGEGPTGVEVATRLRARASQDRTAFVRQYRDAILEMADSIEDTHRQQPVDYDVLIGTPEQPGELGRLRQMGAWRTRAGQDVRMGEEGMRDVDRAMRSAYDDAVEQHLGAEARQRYQQARQQYATLETALDNATTGESAAAGNRGTGLGEHLAFYGAGGGAGIGAMIGGAEGGGVGMLSGLAAGAGARAYRATEPTIRASAAEVAHQLAQSGALSPQHAQVILDAARRGSSALASTYFVLAQRDARFREQIEAALSQDESAQPAAVRAIGARGE